MAVLYDTPGDDRFTGGGNRGTLAESTGVSYTVYGFNPVTIYSIFGGFDQSITDPLGYALNKVGNWH